MSCADAAVVYGTYYKYLSLSYKSGTFQRAVMVCSWEGGCRR